MRFCACVFVLAAQPHTALAMHEKLTDEVCGEIRRHGGRVLLADETAVAGGAVAAWGRPYAFWKVCAGGQVRVVSLLCHHQCMHVLSAINLKY